MCVGAFLRVGRYLHELPPRERKRGREGGKEGGREGRREGGREEGRERGREGGRAGEREGVGRDSKGMRDMMGMGYHLFFLRLIQGYKPYGSRTI